jgi:hypothetical protein
MYKITVPSMSINIVPLILIKNKITVMPLINFEMNPSIVLCSLFLFVKTVFQYKC